MSWAFPNRRLLPVIAAALAYLVLCTAQRGMLLGLVRSETGATGADGLRVMVLGTQVDLAAALALSLPFALWALIVPERAWASKAHRIGVHLVIGLATLAIVALATLESFYFVAHRTRLGPGSAQRVESLFDFLSATRGGAPLVITALLSVAASIIAIALTATLTRRGLDAPHAALGARARDLVLHLLALTFFLGLAMSRQPEFPGRRTLRELSGNGMMPVARVAWRHVPVSWKRLIPRSLKSP